MTKISFYPYLIILTISHFYFKRRLTINGTYRCLVHLIKFKANKLIVNIITISLFEITC